MANKKISGSEDTILFSFKLLPSDKDILDNVARKTGKSASALLREEIRMMENNHVVKLRELKEELHKTETKANILKAQITELETKANKHQNAIILREELLEKSVRGLLFSGKVKPETVFISEYKKYFKARVEGVNHKLNGSGAEPFTEQEYFEKFIAMAQGEGVEVHE